MSLRTILATITGMANSATSCLSSFASGSEQAVKKTVVSSIEESSHFFEINVFEANVFENSGLEKVSMGISVFLILH